MERGWRGRAAIRLWLLGFSASKAWLFALSKDTDWSAYLSHEHLDLIGDRRMPGEALPDVLALGTKAIQRPTA